MLELVNIISLSRNVTRPVIREGNLTEPAPLPEVKSFCEKGAENIKLEPLPKNR